MTYKVLVSDLDSTLLTTQRVITPRTVRAFEQAKEQGKYVTFATGRNYLSALPTITTLEPNAPLILYNGSRIEDPQTRNVLYAKNLKNAYACKAFDLNRRFQIHVSVYCDDEIYIETLTPEAQEFMEKEHVTCHPVGDLTTFLAGRDPIKLLFIGDPEKLHRYAQEYRAIDGNSELVGSEATYLEILPEGVSKGVALRHLAEYLGVTLEEIIAVGDNPNDIDMVQEAGLGVAVANAHPDVKRVADLITESNDQDGVAKIIEEYLLC
ncbi:Cof-type HAD-IIB family hydrolase [candidate division KSB3 bacterium]|uniref:Cof-type HAD-IIB family hydrolase n=1 Tax=candidate division KSB3 bacterium TaxID=2044937 RepID=A0A9D5JZ34_9BACT|nr:Cof-type HAD-IIB family hydrolase [candidate division KSB3 bacterium]MBD3327009.1 Cof-type HAD-IIB family hydrolase [candidate division KSB3 bacterium]